jgi:hypothetical protein
MSIVCKALSCAIFTVVAITSNTAFAQDDAIRKLIVDGSAAGGKPNIYLNVLGKLTRVQLLSADDKGINISLMDNPFPITWKEIPPEHLGPIAGEFAKTGKDFLLLVQFYAANNCSALADKAALAAVDKDRTVAADVAVALNSIKKPDPPPAPATPPADTNKSGSPSLTGVVNAVLRSAPESRRARAAAAAGF